MGQLPLDQVVERMRNKNRDCQHNKTSYRRPALAKPTSVLRVLKTLHSSRTSKPVVSTLKIADIEMASGTASLEMWILSALYYHSYCTTNSIWNSIADGRAEIMPDRFITLVCDLINAVQFNRKCLVDQVACNQYVVNDKCLYLTKWAERAFRLGVR